MSNIFAHVSGEREAIFQLFKVVRPRTPKTYIKYTKNRDVAETLSLALNCLSSAIIIATA